MNHSFTIVIVLLFLLSCTNQSSKNYYTIPATTENAYNMVVEIPAGTNHKIEFDKNSGTFKNDIEEGQNRVIRFLPYPGNYGFIPSTMMSTDRGGDGDPLDILTIGESQPTGSVIEVIPIGVLLLKDNGELDSKIIAIPAEPEKQMLSVKNFQDFFIQHSVAKRLIEDWFLTYKGPGKMELIGWEDDNYARKEIEKWLVPSAAEMKD